MIWTCARGGDGKCISMLSTGFNLMQPGISAGLLASFSVTASTEGMGRDSFQNVRHLHHLTTVQSQTFQTRKVLVSTPPNVRFCSFFIFAFRWFTVFSFSMSIEKGSVLSVSDVVSTQQKRLTMPMIYWPDCR